MMITGRHKNSRNSPPSWGSPNIPQLLSAMYVYGRGFLCIFSLLDALFMWRFISQNTALRPQRSVLNYVGRVRVDCRPHFNVEKVSLNRNPNPNNQRVSNPFLSAMKQKRSHVGVIQGACLRGITSGSGRDPV